jgi:hypothetical protein
MRNLMTRRALLTLSASISFGLAASSAMSQGSHSSGGGQGSGGHKGGPGSSGHSTGDDDTEHSHDEGGHTDTDHEHTEHDPDAGSDHGGGGKGPKYRGGRADAGPIGRGHGRSLEDRVLKGH